MGSVSAQNPQIVDSQEFIGILDYKFTGDSSTVDKKRRFIEGLRNTSTIYHAAQLAGIHRATAYNWMESDPAFARACDDSREDAGDVMETSAYQDALGSDGKRGDPILKMFWLKAHRPKFRDKMTIDIESVRDEIQQRMQSLQLPAANIGQFVDASFISNSPCVDPAPVPAQSPESTQSNQSPAISAPERE